MIGITKISNGRMGNRLFHYNFLRQISLKTEIPYFLVKFPESDFFYEMTRKSRGSLFSKKPIRLSSSDIRKYNSGDFLNYIQEINRSGKNIIIDPPILGDIFFDYLFFNPGQFIKVKNPFKKTLFKTNDKQIIIGIHIRGSDFASWNENAALGFDYYETSINYCLKTYQDKNLSFFICTDDLNFPTYVKTKFLLKNQRVFLGNPEIPAIYDFYNLSQCDILISSPSTFAIWGGILGKKEKKIIHCKKWLDYSTNRNDPFWVKLLKSNNQYYSLWKSF